MRALYSFLVHVAWLHLKVIAHFKPKIKLFVGGRKNVFSTLKHSIAPTDSVIWMHVASLGEYEQGLPILQELKKKYPTHKILLTFFSPSGYEVKKNSNAADIITYLPLDTISNAKKFLQITNPEMVLFVKYEIWPNYLRELEKRKVPTLLVSAVFAKRQVFFKWYGSFMRKSLTAFTHFFVQDEKAKQLLGTLNFNNVTIAGDTRFDRVLEILDGNNRLTFMENFKQDKHCFIVGSSWPEDEKIIIDFVNTSDKKIKYVIAPHNINKEHIQNLKEGFIKKVLCYSEIENKPIEDFDVLIMDTIGLLTKVYSYANLAYVGGGFKTGLHNTLEPAVFGIPIIIGPNCSGFKEAEQLVQKGGITSVKTKEQFSKTVNMLLENKALLSSTGSINSKYIAANKGATAKIISYVQKVL